MEAHHALSEKKRLNIAPVSGKEYGGCGTFRRNSGSALIRPEYCAVRSDTFSLHQFEETGLDTDQAADDVLLILQYPLQHGSCFLITIAAVPGQIAAEIGKRLSVGSAVFRFGVNNLAVFHIPSFLTQVSGQALQTHSKLSKLIISSAHDMTSFLILYLVTENID